jgi:hypothetical protein
MVFLKKASRIMAKYTKQVEDPYEGEISHPELVDGAHCKSLYQVWIDL